MILPLIGAAALTVALRDFTDMAVIAIVVVLNTAVGVAQELRAERALAALRRLSAPSRAFSGGRPSSRPAQDVVPSDVLLLEAGDIVPADARLMEAHRFQTDEAALTGESVPVDKEAGAADRSVADRSWCARWSWCMPVRRRCASSMAGKARGPCMSRSRHVPASVTA
jgi:P-type Ca2+ transporter type 2C